MKRFYILDEREIWHKAAMAAAVHAGYTSTRIFSGDRPVDPGVCFVRPHADWRVLPKNRDDYMALASKHLMLQDPTQIAVYEDKSAQAALWGDWMPDTWRFTDEAAAMVLLAEATYPLMSKADVGASSTNVRILETRAEAERHVRELFGPGVSVHHGAHCPRTKQHGYVLLQRFIPHKITYRVNAIGDARAIFFRFCYPDRMVAQTGNVAPAFDLTPELESLLEYSDRFFALAGTKWCALDILKDTDGSWKLLETSLAWPWPSPGDCNAGAIFRSGGKRWIQMFEVMFDELARGAWGPAP